jgi:neuronal calcium sensor 1
MMRLPEDEATPELRVAKIWPCFNIDADGMMSKEAFIEGSKKDPTILGALNLYNEIC